MVFLWFYNRIVFTGGGGASYSLDGLNFTLIEGDLILNTVGGRPVVIKDSTAETLYTTSEVTGRDVWLSDEVLSRVFTDGNPDDGFNAIWFNLLEKASNDLFPSYIDKNPTFLAFLQAVCIYYAVFIYLGLQNRDFFTDTDRLVRFLRSFSLELPSNREILGRFYALDPEEHDFNDGTTPENPFLNNIALRGSQGTIESDLRALLMSEANDTDVLTEEFVVGYERNNIWIPSKNSLFRTTPYDSLNKLTNIPTEILTDTNSAILTRFFTVNLEIPYLLRLRTSFHAELITEPHDLVLPQTSGAVVQRSYTMIGISLLQGESLSLRIEGADADQFSFVQGEGDDRVLLRELDVPSSDVNSTTITVAFTPGAEQRVYTASVVHSGAGLRDSLAMAVEGARQDFTLTADPPFLVFRRAEGSITTEFTITPDNVPSEAQSVMIRIQQESSLINNFFSTPTSAIFSDPVTPFTISILFRGDLRQDGTLIYGFIELFSDELPSPLRIPYLDVRRVLSQPIRSLVNQQITLRVNNQGLETANILTSIGGTSAFTSPTATYIGALPTQTIEKVIYPAGFILPDGERARDRRISLNAPLIRFSPQAGEMGSVSLCAMNGDTDTYNVSFTEFATRPATLFSTFRTTIIAGPSGGGDTTIRIANQGSFTENNRIGIRRISARTINSENGLSSSTNEVWETVTLLGRNFKSISVSLPEYTGDRIRESIWEVYYPSPPDVPNENNFFFTKQLGSGLGAIFSQKIVRWYLAFSLAGLCLRQIYYITTRHHQQ